MVFPIRLSLGPIQYYWPREVVFDFYESLLDAPVDIVYLGETVCAKRHALRLADWFDIARMLQAAGKEVNISTQVLLESDSHLNTLRRIAENTEFGVEANDMGAVKLLSSKQPFIAGMHLNLFSPAGVRMLAELGAKRWVAPVEFSAADFAETMPLLPEGIEAEVMGYGRLPLAYSSRCFTARHYDLPKDDCQFHCLNHAEGMCLSTREEQAFLRINGIQTLSDPVCSLMGEVHELARLGIAVMRIMPQRENTADVIRLFDAVRSGQKTKAAAVKALASFMPAPPCNGYWHGRPGMEYFVDS